MTLQPDYNASLDFLRKWGGRWAVLTAIPITKKGIETQTFDLEDEATLRAWLEKKGATDNLYFMVNPTTEPIQRKALREHVSELAWLHVDIDPRAGEDLDDERERCLKLLCDPDKLDERKVPPPTVVIFSGGGYQGFWKLRDPFPIEGDIDKAEQAKLWNRQLELLFGGDNCHNVDRIMRLPGSINRPDEKKRKKGRTEALAEVVRFEDSCVYALDQFSKAPETQVKGDAGSLAGQGRLVQISGNIPKLNDVDDLPEAVPDWCKVLIVQGHDPDHPTKYPSRSESLFAVCCELVRAECDDDTIFAVITDPDFEISASVLGEGAAARSATPRSRSTRRARRRSTPSSWNSTTATRSSATGAGSVRSSRRSTTRSSTATD